MPAILTHHLFGKAVLSKLGAGAFPTRDERDAFLLGNQGPDPFFYAVFTPQMVAVKKFGSALHSEKVDESIDALRALVRALPEPQQKVADSYLCGYLCHFTLDSIEHPLIFSQQYAITGAGIKGLDADDGSFVHGQIESDLDTMMLYQLTGRTIREFVVPRQVLFASDEVLRLANSLYTQVALGVYGLELPGDAFSRSVRDMRASVRVLYSPSGKKRVVLGYLERVFRRHSLMQAMSHREQTGEDCAFNNSAHATWTHPFTGDQHDTSFTDGFNNAIPVALENLRLHKEAAATPLITAGLDFDGRPTR